MICGCFFNFLIDNNPLLCTKTIETLTVNDLDKIETTDIDLFLEYITLYQKEVPESENSFVNMQNGEKGRARKLAAIRSMYKYFVKTQKIKTNPASLVDTPKVHDKEIIRLEPDETAIFLMRWKMATTLQKNKSSTTKNTKIVI